MKRLRHRERKRFVRMRMKNRTSERVAIGKEKSRYWESKNNLNVWMRTIQDKSKKKKQRNKDERIKKTVEQEKKKERKIRIRLMQF